MVRVILAKSPHNLTGVSVNLGGLPKQVERQAQGAFKPQRAAPLFSAREGAYFGGGCAKNTCALPCGSATKVSQVSWMAQTGKAGSAKVGSRVAKRVR